MIKNERMAQICNIMKANASAALDARADDILDAWNAAMLQATESGEDTPKFQISIGNSLDISKNMIETTLSFAVRHKEKISSQIPDPDQLEMGL